MLKSSLHSWYDGTISLRGVDLCFCRRKARSIHAFRRPSPAVPPDSSLWISIAQISCASFIQLVGDNLVWLAQDERQIHVLNLRSMTSKVLVCETRESIGDMFVGEQLVAFTARNKGTVFVSELDGRGPVKKFRLPRPSRDFALTCRVRTVACSLHGADNTLIYIWDFDTQQGTSFSVDRDTIPLGPAFKPALHLQPDIGQVLLCQLVAVCRGTEHPEIDCWWFTYAGKCLQTTREVVSEYSNIIRGPRAGIEFVPTSYDGHFRLQCTVSENPVPQHHIHGLDFDERSRTFMRPQHPLVEDIHEQSPVVWWKDTFVASNAGDSIFAHMGTRTNPRYATVVEHKSERSRGQRHGSSREALINDTWIVQPFSDSFYVFCYDHTVQYPGNQGTLDRVGYWESIQPKFLAAK